MENKLQILIYNMIIDNERKNLYVGNFLDEVNNFKIKSMFADEPSFIGLNEVDAVYIVAMIHKLLNDQNLNVPK